MVAISVRRIEAEEAATNEQEQQPQHSLHVIAEEILPANYCDGDDCDIELLAIIDSKTCNEHHRSVYDIAIKVKLQMPPAKYHDEKGDLPFREVR